MQFLYILGDLWIQTKWTNGCYYMDSYIFDFGIYTFIISLVASLGIVRHVQKMSS